MCMADYLFPAPSYLQLFTNVNSHTINQWRGPKVRLEILIVARRFNQTG